MLRTSAIGELVTPWTRHAYMYFETKTVGVLDYRTDATIQPSLQNELSEAIQLTVALRLLTIIDADKIAIPLHGCHIAYVSTSDCLECADGPR